MLIILILLLKSTDFELSGHNIKTEGRFLQNLKNRSFDTCCRTYLLHCVYRRIYRHMRKNNKPVHSENLTSGQIFFKESLVGFV